MFNSDLLIAFAFMALLFLRQVWILKTPNKINYAPLMLGFGAISSMVHFIVHPDTTDLIHLLRESFFPMLVALLLYIVMNILQQTQQSQNARAQEEFAKLLVSELSSLKEFMSELEERMKTSQLQDQSVREEMRKQFQEDIKALDAIQINQANFSKRFDEMQEWHKEVSRGFEHFTNVQLPELDNVVHKHIDILRVAEQDHYNQIKAILKNKLQDNADLSGELEAMKQTLKEMQNLSGDIAKSIIQKTLDQLSEVTQSFHSQIIALKSHTEGVQTSLLEGENRLDVIRQQSEMIMKQMVLSSKKMEELQQQNSEINDLYLRFEEISKDIERIRSDYIKAQSQLGNIAKEITTSNATEVKKMQENVEQLSEKLQKSIEASLEKLHEHYHIASEDISASTQLLAKRAQLKKGYGEFDS